MSTVGRTASRSALPHAPTEQLLGQRPWPLVYYIFLCVVFLFLLHYRLIFTTRTHHHTCSIHHGFFIFYVNIRPRAFHQNLHCSHNLGIPTNLSHNGASEQPRTRQSSRLYANVASILLYGRQVVDNYIIISYLLRLDKCMLHFGRKNFKYQNILSSTGSINILLRDFINI